MTNLSNVKQMTGYNSRVLDSDCDTNIVTVYDPAHRLQRLLDSFNRSNSKTARISITFTFYIATQRPSEDVVVDLSAVNALAFALPKLTMFVADIVLNEGKTCGMEASKIGRISRPWNHGRIKQEVQRGIGDFGRLMLGDDPALRCKVMNMSRHTTRYRFARI